VRLKSEDLYPFGQKYGVLAILNLNGPWKNRLSSLFKHSAINIFYKKSESINLGINKYAVH